MFPDMLNLRKNCVFENKVTEVCFYSALYQGEIICAYKNEYGNCNYIHTIRYFVYIKDIFISTCIYNVSRKYNLYKEEILIEWIYL